MNREPLHRQSVHRRGVNARHGIRISFFTAHIRTTHAHTPPSSILATTASVMRTASRAGMQRENSHLLNCTINSLARSPVISIYHDTTITLLRALLNSIHCRSFVMDEFAYRQKRTLLLVQRQMITKNVCTASRRLSLSDPSHDHMSI